MNYGRRFVTLYRRQESRPSPRKRNAKKQNGCLRKPYIAEKRREVKSKGEKERYIHLNSEFQRIARRDKEALLHDQCKETEGHNRMGKTRDLFKKIKDTKGTLHTKIGTIEDRNSKDLAEAEDIKKMWQEYTEELYKKDLHEPDDQDQVGLRKHHYEPS